MTMQSVWLAQETPKTPPFGAGIVRHVVPFHRSAPVGPPDAMQNVRDEQDTLVISAPGGFFSVRQVVPFQIIASECLTSWVVVKLPTAMHHDAPLQDTDARLAWPPKLAVRCRGVSARCAAPAACAGAARAAPVMSAAMAAASAGAQNARLRGRGLRVACIGIPLS